MTGRRYLNEIRRGLESPERPEDIIRMIDLLTSARPPSPGDSGYKLSGKILCVLFDPLKAQAFDYSRGLRAVRLKFIGIEESRNLQRHFRKAMTPDLLRLDSLSEALALGPERLFSFDETMPPEGSEQSPRRSSPTAEEEVEAHERQEMDA